MPSGYDKWRKQRARELALRTKEARERHRKEIIDALMRKYNEILRALRIPGADLNRLRREKTDVESLIKSEKQALDKGGD